MWNTSSEWRSPCALRDLTFTIIRRLTTRTKKLRSVERRKTVLHFLQQDTQLVLFFFGERGHELQDAVDALRQDPLKEIKRCFGEFNGQHAPVFRMLIALDQRRRGQTIMRSLAEQLEHDELSFREFVALKERLLIGEYIARNPCEVKIGFYRGAIRFGDLAYQVQKELLPGRKAKCAFHRFPLFLALLYDMVPYYV